MIYWMIAISVLLGTFAIGLGFILFKVILILNRVDGILQDVEKISKAMDDAVLKNRLNMLLRTSDHTIVKRVDKKDLEEALNEFNEVESLNK